MAANPAAGEKSAVKQLGLAFGGSAQSGARAPVTAPRTAAQILWMGAGCPECPTVADCTPGPCWWCGHSTSRRGRPLATLAETFPSTTLAAAPASRALCVPCGWTLSDHVRLPAEYARDRIALCADTGRRCQVALRDAQPERRLLLRLADGRIGLWTPGANARSEEPWAAARDDLRLAPATVGPCTYLGAVPLEDLGDGPAKFRAFHHFGTARRWWACTDTDRGAIRDWLLFPPAEPWVGVIGDGKAHAAIYARVSPGAGHGLQCVSYHPSRTTVEEGIDYEPAALARQIAAWEALIIAGAGDDDIATERYEARGLPLLLAIRAHDSTIAPLRGGPSADLVRYLRRSRKELTPDG